ncbi:hypothetical protein A3Q56_02223 [Intoshia linei]|uniref:EGF-like domain-containing protein n=1 Tax=Intoshia linei TaxID=1819745 RepID=A0A177B8N0_9BILA|nr:hypothetical protein A3Q56_02223 [Intoshia linei]
MLGFTSAEIISLLRRENVKQIFLLPYSPDLNPIENLFSVSKSRKINSSLTNVILNNKIKCRGATNHYWNGNSCVFNSISCLNLVNEKLLCQSCQSTVWKYDSYHCQNLDCSNVLSIIHENVLEYSCKRCQINKESVVWNEELKSCYKTDHKNLTNLGEIGCKSRKGTNWNTKRKTCDKVLCDREPLNTRDKCTGCHKMWKSEGKTYYSCPNNSIMCNVSTVTCNAGYFWNKPNWSCDECTISTAQGQCNSCLDKIWITNKCTACPRNCKLCYESNICTECNQNYFWSDRLLSCIECSHITSSICKECSSHNYPFVFDKIYCSEIKHSTEFLCLNCRRNYAFGYFWNQVDNLCQSCLYGCESCDNKNNCIKCKTGFWYNSLKQKCLPCSSNCVECTSKNLCSKCKDNMYFDSTFTIQCKECIKNCRNCSTSKKCIICKNGYYLVEINGELLCKDCGYNCLSCTNTGTCNLCKNGYCLLPNNTCLKNNQNCKLCFQHKNFKISCVDCIDGHMLQLCKLVLEIIDLANGCAKFKTEKYILACMNGCIHCNDINVCLKCNQGYHLNQNKCFKCIDNCDICNNIACLKCKSGYINNSTLNICLACTSHCKECTHKKCIKCMVNAFMNTNKTCQLCSSIIPNCLECYTNKKMIVTCIKCSQPHMTLNNNGTKCLACDKNCKNCIYQKPKCVKCMGNFHLSLNNDYCGNIQCYNCTKYGFGKCLPSEKIGCMNYCHTQKSKIGLEIKYKYGCNNNYCKRENTKECSINDTNCSICCNYSKCNNRNSSKSMKLLYWFSYIIYAYIIKNIIQYIIF